MGELLSTKTHVWTLESVCLWSLNRTPLQPLPLLGWAPQVLNGLLDEAAGLLLAGLAPGANVAARAIGYRQAMETLLEVGASLLRGAQPHR